MLATLCGRWHVLLLRGILAIVLGITAIVWPGVTLVSLVLVFGVFTLIDGVAGIALGIRGGPDGKLWWPMILMGVLAVAAGILTFAWPSITAMVLLAIIAVSAIFRGVFEIYAAIRLRKEIDDEWILGISGAAAILFGVLLIARPLEGAVAIALLLGAYMIAMGILAVALALRLRKMGHKLASK